MVSLCSVFRRKDFFWPNLSQSLLSSGRHVSTHQGSCLFSFGFWRKGQLSINKTDGVWQCVPLATAECIVQRMNWSVNSDFSGFFFCFAFYYYFFLNFFLFCFAALTCRLRKDCAPCRLPLAASSDSCPRKAAVPFHPPTRDLQNQAELFISWAHHLNIAGCYLFPSGQVRLVSEKTARPYPLHRLSPWAQGLQNDDTYMTPTLVRPG